jgi:hypothetical protein
LALRGLEEKAVLAKRMAEAARGRGSSGLAARYRATKAEAEQAAVRIRRLLDDVAAAAAPPDSAVERAP